MSTGVYVRAARRAPARCQDGSLRAGARRPQRGVAGPGEDDPEAWLAQQLFEYAGFALFHAGSLLARADEKRLNARVAEMLKPLRQQPEGAPPSRRSPPLPPPRCEGNHPETR